jgi:ABC-type nitrate/sulfonate/bicarbonate transport system substrate-binding protein
MTRGATIAVSTRLFVGIAIVAMLAACGSGTAPSASPSGSGTAAQGDVYKLHMRITPSDAAWVVAQEEGLFDRLDLDYELVGYGESAQLFLAGTDPVGQESPLEAARFQSEGEDISFFSTASALSFYSGVIIRAADADKYKTLSDLKGKKLGQPGFGTGTWQAFEIIAEANYGLTAKTDFQTVEADPGALLGLLQKGDLDAIVEFTGQTATALTNPDFKVVLNFSEDWAAKHGGQPLVINGLMARRSWLDANTDVARRLIEGVDKGLQWRKDHPDAFAKGGKYSNIVEGEGWYTDPATTAKVLELLQAGKWYLKADQFTQAWVDSNYEFINEGKGVFAKEVPPKDQVFYLPLLQK